MAREYLCDQYTPIKYLYKPFISLVMRSHAKLCVIPMQDYLGYDNSCRMNKPSTVGTNWKWRITREELSDGLKDEIYETSRRYGRLGWQWRNETAENGKEDACSSGEAKLSSPETA